MMLREISSRISQLSEYLIPKQIESEICTKGKKKKKKKSSEMLITITW